jgi:hypothetical protein
VKRPVPPQELTEGFLEKAFSWYHHGGTGGAGDRPMRLFDGGPACWLWQFDMLERPCSGRLEGVHLLGRQQIRHTLRRQLATDAWAEGAIDPADVDDLVQLAEWDPRNAAAGCTGHHRRFDSHATPELLMPAEALPLQALIFITSWGFEDDAERKFHAGEHSVAEVIAHRHLQLERLWGYQGPWIGATA